jgi:hypothetical protein
MFVWCKKASGKVHQLGSDGRTLCQFENNPRSAGNYISSGEVAPSDRTLCGICRYLRKRPANKARVSPEEPVPATTTPAKVESHRLLPPAPTSFGRPAASMKLGGNAPKIRAHPDDDQHYRLRAQRAYEGDRLAMSQYIRSCRAAHYKVLRSVGHVPQSLCRGSACKEQDENKP